MNILTELKDDELLIIIYDNYERSLIHSFIENHYNELGHVGLLIPKFNNDRKTFKICYSCKKFVLMEYSNGVMKNNIDEFYDGYCDNCCINFLFEPNYDGYTNIVRAKLNNAICIGKSIKINKPEKSISIDVSI